jgi:hypothetical protein
MAQTKNGQMIVPSALFHGQLIKDAELCQR